MWQPSAVPLELADPSGGHSQAHWAVIICKQGHKFATQNAYPECSLSLQEPQEWLLPCSQVKPQFHTSEFFHHREQPLSLSIALSSELLSLPASAGVHLFPSATPLPPRASMQPPEIALPLSPKTEQLGSLRSTEVHSGRGLLCSKAQSRCSMDKCVNFYNCFSSGLQHKSLLVLSLSNLGFLSLGYQIYMDTLHNEFFFFTTNY